MEPMEILSLVMRWLHILAAITAVGGTIFSRFVVLPAHTLLPAQQRAELHAAMRRRWSKLVAASIAALLVSGLYHFAVLEMKYTVPAIYHALFGVKFLLAMVIFAVASLLSGRSAASEKTRANAGFWMNLNIVLAVIVVCISGYLRSMHNQGLPEKLPRAVAVSGVWLGAECHCWLVQQWPGSTGGQATRGTLHDYFGGRPGTVR